MILNKKQLNELSEDTRSDLLSVLWAIEDELQYKCKKVTKTIDYLEEVKK